MAALTDAEIAAMQDFVSDHLLPDTCVIKSKTRVNTRTGATYTETTVATVACRVGVPKLEERLTAQRLGYELDAILTFADSQAIDPAYRITVGGHTYEVIAPDIDRAWRIAGRVRVRKVTTSG